MLIGDFAKLTGLTTKALRHYDEVGVLRPETVAESGYRHYSARQLRRAVVVAALREAGVPLAEVAAVDDEAQAVEVLARHRERVTSERAALDAAMSAADVTVSAAARRPEVREREASRPYVGLILDTADMRLTDPDRIENSMAALRALLTAQGCPPTGPVQTRTQWRTADALDVVIAWPVDSVPDLPERVDGSRTTSGTLAGGTELVTEQPADVEESSPAFLLAALALYEELLQRGVTPDSSRLTTRSENGATLLSYRLSDDGTGGHDAHAPDVPIDAVRGVDQ